MFDQPPAITDFDRRCMRMALQEAEEAFAAGEIPVGAVVAAQGKILAKGRNQTELLHDVTAHAEMIAITSAANSLGAKFLTDCTLYITLEPCVMCAGAIFWARPSRLVVGAPDEKRGFSSVAGLHLLHPKTSYISGVMAEESRALLQEFFRQRRELQ